MDQTIRKIAEIVRANYIDEKLAAEVSDKLLEFVNSSPFLRFQQNNDLNRLIWSINCLLTTTTDDGHFSVTRLPNAGMGPMFSSSGIARFTPHYIRFTSIADISQPTIRSEIQGVLAMAQDPLILDLRDCPGGSPESAYFILSHFFPDGVPLFKMLQRDKEPRVFKAASVIPFYNTFNTVKKYTGRIHVLINFNTASAAENIAFVLKNRGRAKLYGSRTGAYAHATMIMEMDNLWLKIPYAKTVDPDNLTDWEKTGVAPDYDVQSREYISLIFNGVANELFSPMAKIDIKHK